MATRALAAIEASPPDIVLTDMQMPNMDGLQLVTHVRQRHPAIPIILVTGRGSESLATKALKAGAAGYVPKSHSNELLTETVRHVLSLVETVLDEDRSRIQSMVSVVHYEWQLENDESLIPGLLQSVRQHIAELLECDPVVMLQLEVALEHAVQNGIYHGNLEVPQATWAELDHDRRRAEARRLSDMPSYAERRVHVTLHLTRKGRPGLSCGIREMDSTSRKSRRSV